MQYWAITFGKSVVYVRAAQPHTALSRAAENLPQLHPAVPWRAFFNTMVNIKMRGITEDEYNAAEESKKI